GPEHEIATVEIMLQRGRQLAADVRGILRIAHTIGHPVKATDASVPSLGELAALEHVHAFHPLEAVGHPQGSEGLVRPGAQDEIRRRTRLALGEECARSALDNLDALDRIIETYE